MKNFLAQAVPNDPSVFGRIQAPEAVQNYGLLGDTGGNGGLIGFMSNLVILATVVAGLWSLWNILLAGFSVISSSSDSKKVGEMSERITRTFIGLLVMISAPLLAGLIGYFLTGDSAFFLRPQIFGPGEF